MRSGDVVEETESAQRVGWEVGDHLYFNPGPARLPHHHQGILGYCRELGVPVEVMVNDNRAAYMQDDAVFDGKPQSARAVINDARGFIAELAAKAIDQAALDGPVTIEDKERVRAFVRAFGALDKELAYHGSSRAGYVEPPGAGSEAGKSRPPLDCGNCCCRISGKARRNSARPTTRRRRCCSRSEAWGVSARLLAAA